jgi:hypothetical protein
MIGKNCPTEKFARELLIFRAILLRVMPRLQVEKLVRRNSRRQEVCATIGNLGLLLR